MKVCLLLAYSELFPLGVEIKSVFPISDIVNIVSWSKHPAKLILFSTFLELQVKI